MKACRGERILGAHEASAPRRRQVCPSLARSPSRTFFTRPKAASSSSSTKMQFSGLYGSSIFTASNTTMAFPSHLHGMLFVSMDHAVARQSHGTRGESVFRLPSLVPRFGVRKGVRALRSRLRSRPSGCLRHRRSSYVLESASKMACASGVTPCPILAASASASRSAFSNRFRVLSGHTCGSSLALASWVGGSYFATFVITFSLMMRTVCLAFSFPFCRSTTHLAPASGTAKTSPFSRTFPLSITSACPPTSKSLTWICVVAISSASTSRAPPPFSLCSFPLRFGKTKVKKKRELKKREKRRGEDEGWRETKGNRRMGAPMGHKRRCEDGGPVSKVARVDVERKHWGEKKGWEERDGRATCMGGREATWWCVQTNRPPARTGRNNDAKRASKENEKRNEVQEEENLRRDKRRGAESAARKPIVPRKRKWREGRTKEADRRTPPTGTASANSTLA